MKRVLAGISTVTVILPRPHMSAYPGVAGRWMDGLNASLQNDVNMVQFKFQKRFDMIDENDFDDQDFSSRPQGHLRLFMGAFPVVTHSAADWVTTPARKLDVGPVSMSMGSSERWQVRESEHGPPLPPCTVLYGT
jgi:hypothetical protein